MNKNRLTHASLLTELRRAIFADGEEWRGRRDLNPWSLPCTGLKLSQQGGLYLSHITTLRRGLGTPVSSLYGAPRRGEGSHGITRASFELAEGLHRYPGMFTPVFPREAAVNLHGSALNR